MSDGQFQIPQYNNGTPTKIIIEDVADKLLECQYRLSCIENLVELNLDNEALGLRLREFINKYK